MERSAAGSRSNFTATTISSASWDCLACRPMPNDKLRHQTKALLLRILGLGFLCLTGCGRAGANGKPWQEFSGEKALAHVQALVGLGPRPAPSAALDKARAYIREKLRATGWA